MRIIIDHYEKRYSAELPEESSLDEVIEAIRNLLVSTGFRVGQIDKYIYDPEVGVSQTCSLDVTHGDVVHTPETGESFGI